MDLQISHEVVLSSIIVCKNDPRAFLVATVVSEMNPEIQALEQGLVPAEVMLG